MGTAKHWPGGGKVTDTHVAGGKTPAWSKLQRLTSFRSVRHSRRGSAGHGESRNRPGPEQGPARVSVEASAREPAAAGGDRTLIITDSLMMAAVTMVMEQTQGQAAVRALANGADLALIQTGKPSTVRNAVARAIDSGRFPREQAIASVRQCSPPSRPGASRTRR